MTGQPTRPLLAVSAEPAVLIPALAAALGGSGPALLPLDPASPQSAAPAEVPAGVALVVRTSGSSGAPKSVALSAAALTASARATEQALGGAGSWVLALPGHYIAGAQVVIRALLAGGEPVVMDSGPFTADKFARAAARLPASGRAYCSLVPTQLLRMVDAVEEGDASAEAAAARFDAVLIGGGRLAPALAARAEAAGIRFVRTYGASETAGGCVYDGVPLNGVLVREVDGEVQLGGPMLAEGYLEDPERTARAFLLDGGVRWYRTGDAGEWDGQRLAMQGRLDDVIITGGEKVSLGLLEQVVQQVEGLAGALVVRAPDPEWGEVPVVVADRPVDLAALRTVVAERLGRRAAPRRVLLVPEIPTLASGKPDRVRLALLAAED